MREEETFMRPKRPGKLMRAQVRAGYLMIAPLFLGLGLFYIYAFGQSLYDSFTNKSSFGVPKFIGLTNYINLFKAPYFYQSLGNTLLYVVLCVPLVVALMWKWLLNYEFGLVNGVFKSLGIAGVAWLSDPVAVLPSVSVVFIWSSVAYQVIVLLAGLQGISRS